MYAGFSNIAGLNLLGSAATNGSVLRLTPAVTNAQGAAWYSQKLRSYSPELRYTNGFSTSFTFQITDQGPGWAAVVPGASPS